MKIGLTGSIACGKTTVSDHLRALGYPVVDADALSRALTAPGGAALPAIREVFGDSVFHPDGTLDRRALGSIVFTDPSARTLLDDLLHPMILAGVFDQLKKLDTGDTIVFGDVPLLYECHMESWFDAVWVVALPRALQTERLMLRDGISRQEAESRIDSQMPLAQKTAMADEVIDTSGSIEETRARVDALLDKLR